MCVSRKTSSHDSSNKRDISFKNSLLPLATYHMLFILRELVCCLVRWVLLSINAFSDIIITANSVSISGDNLRLHCVKQVRNTSNKTTYPPNRNTQ